MKPFANQTPLERAKDHISQVTRGSYRPAPSGGSSPDGGSSSSESASSAIQNLNRQEDQAWREATEARNRGDSEGARYYEKEAERLSERAFERSHSAVQSNLAARNKSGCLVVLALPFLGAALWRLLQ